MFCLIFCKTQQPTFFFRDTRKSLLKIAFFFHTKQVFFGRFSNGQRSLSYFRGLLQAKLPLSVTEVEKKKVEKCRCCVIGFLRGGAVISLIFPNVPQSSLGIFKVPQSPLPLEHHPVRILQLCVWHIYPPMDGSSI